MSSQARKSPRKNPAPMRLSKDEVTITLISPTGVPLPPVEIKEEPEEPETEVPGKSIDTENHQHTIVELEEKSDKKEINVSEKLSAPTHTHTRVSKSPKRTRGFSGRQLTEWTRERTQDVGKSKGSKGHSTKSPGTPVTKRRSTKDLEETVSLCLQNKVTKSTILIPPVSSTPQKSGRKRKLSEKSSATKSEEKIVKRRQVSEVDVGKKSQNEKEVDSSLSKTQIEKASQDMISPVSQSEVKSGSGDQKVLTTPEGNGESEDFATPDQGNMSGLEQLMMLSAQLSSLNKDSSRLNTHIHRKKTPKKTPRKTPSSRKTPLKTRLGLTPTRSPMSGVNLRTRSPRHSPFRKRLQLATPKKSPEVLDKSSEKHKKNLTSPHRKKLHFQTPEKCRVSRTPSKSPRSILKSPKDISGQKDLSTNSPPHQDPSPSKTPSKVRFADQIAGAILKAAKGLNKSNSGEKLKKLSGKKLRRNSNSASENDSDDAEMSLGCIPLKKKKARKRKTSFISKKIMKRKKKVEAKQLKSQDQGKTGDNSSENSSDEWEIDSDSETELDRMLEDRSQAIKLTATNVKSILHEVITNQHVLDMVKNTLQTEGIGQQFKEAIFEPKMTRSRVKEVLGQQNVWPVSPIKAVKPSKPQFMEMSFSDNEEDDTEYKPDLDELERESDEDNESITSSQASDFGSPIPPSSPVTPIHVTEPPLIRKKMLSFVRDIDSDSSNMSSQDIMGPPPPGKPKLKSRFLSEAASGSHSGENKETQEEEGTIAYRTRSKNPLDNTTIYEIESSFVAPDITPDMYDSDCDDQDWQQFLKSLYITDSTQDLNDTLDDENNDPEYNVLAALEAEKDDEEDFRNDKAVNVTKKELNLLMDELFEVYENPEEEQFMDDDNSLLEDKESVIDEAEDNKPKNEKEKPALCIPKVPPTILSSPLVHNVLGVHRGCDLTITKTDIDKGDIPVFTEEEKLQLIDQMRKHTQLLAQTYVMTLGYEDFNEMAKMSKQYLGELKSLGENSRLPQGMTSYFHAYNLQGALELVDREVPSMPNLDNDSVLRKCYRDNGWKLHGKFILRWPLFEQMKMLCTSRVFIFPQMLPEIRFLPQELHGKEKTKNTFSEAEDNLLAIAVEQFHKLGNSTNMICQLVLPTKNKKQVESRLKNLRCGKASDSNPIKYFRTHGKLPTFPRYTEVEAEDTITTPENRPSHLLPDWFLVYQDAKAVFEKRQKQMMIKSPSKATTEIAPLGTAHPLAGLKLFPASISASGKIEVNPTFTSGGSAKAGQVIVLGSNRAGNLIFPASTSIRSGGQLVEMPVVPEPKKQNKTSTEPETSMKQTLTTMSKTSDSPSTTSSAALPKQKEHTVQTQVTTADEVTTTVPISSPCHSVPDVDHSPLDITTSVSSPEKGTKKPLDEELIVSVSPLKNAGPVVLLSPTELQQFGAQMFKFDTPGKSSMSFSQSPMKPISLSSNTPRKQNVKFMQSTVLQVGSPLTQVRSPMTPGKTFQGVRMVHSPYTRVFSPAVCTSVSQVGVHSPGMVASPSHSNVISAGQVLSPLVQSQSPGLCAVNSPLSTTQSPATGATNKTPPSSMKKFNPLAFAAKEAGIKPATPEKCPVVHVATSPLCEPLDKSMDNSFHSVDSCFQPYQPSPVSTEVTGVITGVTQASIVPHIDASQESDTTQAAKETFTSPLSNSHDKCIENTNNTPSSKYEPVDLNLTAEETDLFDNVPKSDLTPEQNSKKAGGGDYTQTTNTLSKSPQKVVPTTPTKSALEVVASLAQIMVTPTKTTPPSGLQMSTPEKIVIVGTPHKSSPSYITPTKNPMVTPTKQVFILPKGEPPTTPVHRKPICGKPKSSPRRKILQQKAKAIAPKGFVVTPIVLSPAKKVAASIKARAKRGKNPSYVSPVKFRRILSKLPTSRRPNRPSTSTAEDQEVQNINFQETDNSEYDTLESDVLTEEDDIISGEDKENDAAVIDKTTKRMSSPKKKSRKRKRQRSLCQDSDDSDFEQASHSFSTGLDHDSQEENDDQDHLATLMAASTSIRFDHRKGLSQADRKKYNAKQRRQTTIDLLSVDMDENDPLRDERDTAMAEAYLNKVRETLKEDQPKYEEFLRLLYEFEKAERTPVELYNNMTSLLSPYPDLIRDFAGFLLPDQAEACGCYMTNLEFTRARTFLRKLEVHFHRNPAVLQKILKTFMAWKSGKDKNPDELKKTVIPLLRGQAHLLEEFSLFFVDEKPPESYMTDFENVVLDSDEENSNGAFDGFEDVTIPDKIEDDYYGTKRCKCSCHSKKDKLFCKRKKHCVSCGTKIIRGNIYLQINEKTLRPARIVYKDPAVNARIMRQQQAAESRETEEKDEDDFVCNDEEEEEDFMEDMETNIELQEMGDSNEGLEENVQEKKGVVNGLINGEDKLTNGDSNVNNHKPVKEQNGIDDRNKDDAQVIGERQVKATIEPMKEEDKHCNTNTDSANKESKDTDQTSKTEKIILKINLKNETVNASESQKSEDKEEKHKNEEAGVSEYKETKTWSRDEDRKILVTCQTNGSTPEVFMTIASDLQNRTVEEVEKRFNELMQLFTNQEDGSSEDSSSENEEKT